jgi:C-terminal processing protease CtpA/Prc
VGETRDWSAEVETLTAKLREHYVFPDVAERICSVLYGKLANSRYQSLANDESFAAAATADMQSVSGDKHLRLIFSPDEIADEPMPDPCDDARYRQEAELAGYGIARVERLPGNVALLEVTRLLDVSFAGPAAAAAMNLVAGADVLLLDLRRNRGGQPAMVALLCSYLLDEPTHLNDMYNRRNDSTRQWWSHAFVPGPTFGGSKPVYVLTSSSTFSGGEELSYNLKQLKRATLVGETTGGGAHPADGHRVGSHLIASVPWGRSINPVSGTNWEGTGVKPDIAVSADEAFSTAYQLALEHVLSLGTEAARRMVAEEARQALGGLRAG